MWPPPLEKSWLRPSKVNVKITIFRYPRQWSQSTAEDINQDFWSLLPLRCKLLCCPSEWVSQCNNKIQALNELCRFWSDGPIFETSLETEFSSEYYYTEMLLSFIFGPSEVKYDIVSNNRRSKLHAVIDCLFFFSITANNHWSRPNYRPVCYCHISHPCKCSVPKRFNPSIQI